MKTLGWCAFGFTAVMCLHFATAWLTANKPPLNRVIYGKTAFVLAVHAVWALAEPSFNKVHLLWLYWLAVWLVATLVGKWAIRSFNQSIGMPAPFPLPPLTTALVLQLILLGLLS